jgi:hypothetical protein
MGTLAQAYRFVVAMPKKVKSIQVRRCDAQESQDVSGAIARNCAWRECGKLCSTSELSYHRGVHEAEKLEKHEISSGGLLNSMRAESVQISFYRCS